PTPPSWSSDMAWMKQLLTRPRRGQNFVELAFVLPVCLWILLGIVDFGRVYFFYTSATNAAREGARYWGSNPSASLSTIQTRVQAESTPAMTITVTRTPSGSCVDTCQVNVQYSFTVLTPFISNVTGNPMTM